MPLTTCVDCGQSVSDRADACIHCGAPIAPPSKKIVTTQGTAKKLKMQQALSAIMLVLAVMFVIGGKGEPGATVAASSLGFIALVWFLVTRVRIWWNHD